MENTKKSIFRHVLEDMNFSVMGDTVRTVILGASDKRYIPIHQRIFEEILNKTVQMTTFDIDTKHLDDGKGVVQHDVTLPFPKGHYDIILSHALMKFLAPDEQFRVIKNSYDALSENGLTMHIMHVPELKGTAELRNWQYRVDIDSLATKLKQIDIPVRILHFESSSTVGWLRDTTVLAIHKS
jgi:hypothetical protein